MGQASRTDLSRGEALFTGERARLSKTEDGKTEVDMLVFALGAGRRHRTIIFFRTYAVGPPLNVTEGIFNRVEVKPFQQVFP